MPYNPIYFREVAETQSYLFGYVQDNFPNWDIEFFVDNYMKSDIKDFQEKGNPFFLTMSFDVILDRLRGTCTRIVDKLSADGFVPEWAGELYAQLQIQTGVASRDLVDLVPYRLLRQAYPVLHFLDMDLAVEKVAAQAGLPIKYSLDL